MSGGQPFYSLVPVKKMNMRNQNSTQRALGKRKKVFHYHAIAEIGKIYFLTARFQWLPRHIKSLISQITNRCLIPASDADVYMLFPFLSYLLWSLHIFKKNVFFHIKDNYLFYLFPRHKNWQNIFKYCIGCTLKEQHFFKKQIHDLNCNHVISLTVFLFYYKVLSWWIFLSLLPVIRNTV